MPHATHTIRLVDGGFVYCLFAEPDPVAPCQYNLTRRQRSAIFLGCGSLAALLIFISARLA